MWGVQTIVVVPASTAARAIATDSRIERGPVVDPGQEVAVEVDHPHPA